jgi:hypothetical protein
MISVFGWQSQQTQPNHVTRQDHGIDDNLIDEGMHEEFDHLR